MIERTRFRSIVFLCSEFKLENIYFGVNFCGKMSAVILFAGTYFCGSLEKPQNLEPAKISCHTVDRPTRFEILHSFTFIHNCIR